jgi:hypothetical protein
MSKRNTDRMSALNMKIDSLRVEADRLNSSLATQERHIQVLQSEYARKAATAAARRVEISNHIRRLEEEIVEAKAKAKIESLWLAAKALDAGFTDRRLVDLDYLTKELQPRYIKVNHEVRSLTYRRMRNDKDIAFTGRPFADYTQMITAKDSTEVFRRIYLASGLSPSRQNSGTGSIGIYSGGRNYNPAAGILARDKIVLYKARGRKNESWRPQARFPSWR